MRHASGLLFSTLLLLVPAPGFASVSRFTVAGLPTCGDAVADGKMVIVTDPDDEEDCTVGGEPVATALPHPCVCDWDGAIGTWRIHSHIGSTHTHTVIANDLTVEGDLTLDAADPSVIYDSAVSGDTDFWMGVQDDAGGDDDDVFEIGDGATPGSNVFLTIDTAGDMAFSGKGDFTGDLTSLGEVTITNSADTFAVMLSLVNDENAALLLQNNDSTFAWRLETSGGSGQQIALQETSDGGVELVLTEDGDLTVLGIIVGTRLAIDVGTGFGKSLVDGSLGGQLTLRDTDDAGWTCLRSLNGSFTAFTEADANCP